MNQNSDNSTTMNTDLTKLKHKRKPTSTPTKLTCIEDTKSNTSLKRNLLTLESVQEHEKVVPHFSLFKLVASELLQAYQNRVFDPADDLSQLALFIQSSTNSNLYHGNTQLQSFVHELLPTLDSNDVQSLKLVDALITIINLNILNYSVYVDKKVISKYKLFDIIEWTVFTQLLPTECTIAKANFKQHLAQQIDELRARLSEENFRGLGKSARKQRTSSSPQSPVQDSNNSSETQATSVVTDNELAQVADQQQSTLPDQSQQQQSSSDQQLN